MTSLNNVSTTVVGNQNIVYSSGSGSWGSVDDTISYNSDMTDFFELVLARCFKKKFCTTFHFF